MNGWGNRMHDAVEVLSKMIAIGFDLSPDTFTDMTKFGPHLLAPTGSDLMKYGKVDTVLAGFHQDLNFLTIHGKPNWFDIKDVGSSLRLRQISISWFEHLDTERGKDSSVRS